MIGERLAEIRKDHGDTQLALAQKLHIALSTIRSWEQEKSSPSHDMLVAVCRLYGVSSDYLLGLSDADMLRGPGGQSDPLSALELAELKNYEAYLRWKRRL